MVKTSKNKGSLCPCGSGLVADICCFPLILGQRNAESAEQLMRSRYTAYSIGDAAYILRTWHPESAPASIDFPAANHWTGLQVIRHQSKGANEAEVEFIASYISGGERGQMHELSRFIKQDNVWLYVDGKHIESHQVRAATLPGRNDPCYCGSGKKYKKCCAP